MTFSELKLNAKTKINPHKRTLYRVSVWNFILSFFVFLLGVSSSFESHHPKNAGSLSYLSGPLEFLADIALFSLLLSLIGMIVEIYRGNAVIETKVWDNLRSGNTILRSFLGYFLRSLFTGLWTVLFLLPGVIFLGIGIAGMLDSNHTISVGASIFLYAIGGILLVAAVFMYFLKAMQFTLLPYLLAEDPSLDVLDGLKKSKFLMKKHKNRLFWFQFSFIGWMLLSVITIGIVWIFIYPYYVASNYEYYQQEIVSKTKEAE